MASPRSSLRMVSNLLIVTGMVVMGWPLGQTAFAHWQQARLQSGWQAEQQRQSRPTSGTAPLPAVPVPAAAALPAWPNVRLIIPAIGLDAVVVNGWDQASLRYGPAHDPASGLPGAGHCLIAGHRNVYGSWFYRVDELESGALIELRTPRHRWQYRVLYTTVVSDMDQTLGALPAPGDPPLLSLITCTMPHTNNRIAVVAGLVS